MAGQTKEIWKAVLTALLTLIVAGSIAVYGTLANAVERLDTEKVDRTEMKYVVKSLDEIKEAQKEQTHLLQRHMEISGKSR